jgi:NSS family neurotransmitter:Na+ symporter
MTEKTELWSGRFGFFLANTAAAVGLGSIWKFPYEVGSNGGSAFVLCYLLGLLLIVLPLMLAELAIGRRGRSDAIRSVVIVAVQSRGSAAWSAFALLGIITGFLILSFYSVIGGWAIAYAADVLINGLGQGNSAAARMRFNALLASPFWLLCYHFAFMAMTGVIVARGIARGIEAASRILMPILVLLIAALAAYSSLQGDLATTLRFLFAFDLTSITPKIALEALGLGFFSIGVGFAVMITYAAYAGRDIDLVRVAVLTVASDTAISLLAGFAVFPIVFAEHLDPASGPGLVFITLPVAFAHIPFGTLAAAAFFLLLVLAALGSAISLLELSAAPLKHTLRCSPAVASLLCAAAAWTAGIATVLSFNRWAGWFPLGAMANFATATVFDLIDHLTSNVMLPAAGFGIAIFIGWIAPEAVLREELQLGRIGLTVVRVLLRYVVPIGIAAASAAPLV